MDDAFDAKGIAERLIVAGYSVVERFTTHFPREDNPDARQQNVKDSRVLKLCNTNGWLLVTTDSDMRYTHIEEIKKLPNLAILATAHNSVLNPFDWVEGLEVGRIGIERLFKKQQTPWYAQFNRQGKITTRFTVTEAHITRRNRPNEKDHD